MPTNDPDAPSTPTAAYMALMDELVTKTRPAVTADWVVKKRMFTNAPATRERFNGLVQSLTPPQRQVLAEMLQQERDGAIHDTLALLTWWIECAGLALTYRGVPIFPSDDEPDVGMSGMGLHGDFVARRDGWTWRNNAAPGGGLTPPNESR